jgi:predicted Fe-Mo cluster-binding NifX family protein
VIFYRGELEMIIAIPVFGTRISPCFEYAPDILLAKVEGDTIVDIHKNSFPEGDAIRKVNYIKKRAVNTVVCGGISNFSKHILSGSGITVIPWITGEAYEILNLFL